MLVPLAGGSLLADLSREDLESQLNTTLEKAKNTYRYRAGLSGVKTNPKKLSEQQKKLLELAKKKRQVRLQLAGLIRFGTRVPSLTQTLLREHEKVQAVQAEEESKLQSLLQIAFSRRLVMADEGKSGIAYRLFVESLPESHAKDLRETVFIAAQNEVLMHLAMIEEAHKLSLMRLHAAAGDNTDEIVKLRSELDVLRKDYLKAQKTVDTANYMEELSEDQLLAVKRTVAEVHSQVLKLQNELARIDSRLRRKAERELIEMGLREGRPGQYSDGRIASPGDFAWPLYGPISAGFHNEAYEKVFHVPHQGTDIVAAQGTTVRSAADGVVFVVRDGGQTGYSYILIGHRGGYATLYGHLSAMSVEPGQEVRQGDVIGLSGGARGSYGAGPMTTGSHLHFELLENGVHKNALELLP
jgi:murein DD-endopeptidase MepM/ murein hydrolase activator NlpD